MLVGSRVEHVVRTIHLEQSLHARVITDCRHHGLCFHIMEIARHHQADIVLWGLCLVYENHQLGIKLCQLAHNLRADTASRTRHHHTFATYQFLHGIQVHLNLFTREQVLNLHLAQL